VVYPTHTRVRSRVVRHLKEALTTWHTAHRHGSTFRSSPTDIRALSATLASYQGHFRHANARRLTDTLMRRHPWAEALARPMRFDYRLEGKTLTFNVAGAQACR
jgi:hypothetical protein